MPELYLQYREAINQTLTVVAFCVGVFALCRALSWWWWFRGDDANVSKAFRYSMREQCISSGGTLAFTFTATVSAVTGADLALWNSLPPEVASAIRLTMYAAIITATDRLGMSVDELRHRKPEGTVDILKRLDFESPYHRTVVGDIIRDLERAGDDNHV